MYIGKRRPGEDTEAHREKVVIRKQEQKNARVSGDCQKLGDLHGTNSPSASSGSNQAC
jgi:hypothetical protein